MKVGRKMQCFCLALFLPEWFYKRYCREKANVISRFDFDALFVSQDNKL
jgi:hypothetical protein